MNYIRNNGIDFPMEMIRLNQSNLIKLEGDNNVLHKK